MKCDKSFKRDQMIRAQIAEHGKLVAAGVDPTEARLRVSTKEWRKAWERDYEQRRKASNT